MLKNTHRGICKVVHRPLVLFVHKDRTTLEE